MNVSDNYKYSIDSPEPLFSPKEQIEKIIDILDNYDIDDLSEDEDEAQKCYDRIKNITSFEPLKNLLKLTAASYLYLIENKRYIGLKIILTYIAEYGKSYQEIAEMLGTSKQSVASTILRVSADHEWLKILAHAQSLKHKKNDPEHPSIQHTPETRAKMRIAHARRQRK